MFFVIGKRSLSRTTVFVNMLTPRSVLITGSNRGIGLGFVKQFLQLAKPPEHIIACCRNPETAKELNEIASSNPAVKIHTGYPAILTPGGKLTQVETERRDIQCEIVELDVVKQDTIDKAKSVVAGIVENEGLNLLINNSGIFVPLGLEEVTREEMNRHFQVNTLGPLMVAQAFVPLLKQAASQHPTDPMSCSKAGIINMSSGTGSISENSTGGMYPSRISKAALNMITSNLSLDLKADGILCTAIHPGWVKTDCGGPNALVSTEESIQGIMDILETLQGDEGSGKFYHAIRGEIIGW